MSTPDVQSVLPMEGSHMQLTVGETEIERLKRKQRQILTTAIILVVLLIAIVIGLAVGLRDTGSSSSTNAAGSVTATAQPIVPQPTFMPVTPNPTPNPTPIPPTPRPTESYTEVRQYLLTNNITNEQALNNPISPQSQALLFMQGIGIPPDPTGYDAYKYMERYVLAVVYYSLDGPSWTYGLNFVNPNSDTCFWSQLFFDGTSTFRDGTLCFVDTALVGALRLHSNNAGGTIPSELGLLSLLQIIDLSLNERISGSIPDTFRRLTDLRTLVMPVNRLAGPFPSYLNDLTNLQTFYISNNMITGSIPADLRALTKLDTFAVDDNMLTGSVTQLNELPTLRRVYLEDNQFSSRIDNTFFTSLTTLEHLDLSVNELTGTVPLHFFDNYANMTVLDLHGNKLNRSLPSSFPVNNKLEFLAFSNNQLTGDVHPSLANLRALTHLDLSGNNWNGTMPMELGSLNKLVYLFMASTTFAPGSIPSAYDSLSLIEDLSLKDSNRNGKIPTWIGRLDNLLLLDLDSNQLTGPIPSEVGGMVNIRFLLLNHNLLTGDIPPQLGSLEKLRLAMLENNTLTGSVDAICTDRPSVTLIADCEGDPAEVACSCCAQCCQDGEACVDGNLLANQDGWWESGYQRAAYIFNDDLGYWA